MDSIKKKIRGGEEARMKKRTKEFKALLFVVWLAACIMQIVNHNAALAVVYGIAAILFFLSFLLEVTRKDK